MARRKIRRGARTAGALLTMLGLVISVISFMASPVSAEHTAGSDFDGDCTGTATSGTCTIDEPEGNNPDTYGTVEYNRSFDTDSEPNTDTITFTIEVDVDGDGDPDPDILDEVQICVTSGEDSNPYDPTHANTCAGNTSDRVYDVEDVTNPHTAVINLMNISGHEAGEVIYFTLHIVFTDNGEQRTTYVTGRSNPNIGSQTFSYSCVAPSNVTASSATLNASTDDPAADSAVFTLKQGSTTVATLTDSSLSNGAASVNATGLTANTSYTYTAEFRDGTTSLGTASGSVCAFTTSTSTTPTYSCVAPSNVTASSATLNASTDNANADSAVFTLKQGSTTVATLTDSSLSNGAASVNATGLTANTSYTYTAEFRDGTTSLGTASGSVCAFTTDAAQTTVRSLTVSKDFVGAVGEPVIEVTVDCTGTDFDQTFSLGDNGARTINNIPNGTECTVSENPFQDDVAQTSEEDSIFWNETVNGQPGTSTDVVLSQNRSVDFVNTRTVVQGELIERPPTPPSVTPPPVSPPPAVTPPPAVQPNVVTVTPPPAVQPNVVERPTAVRGAVLARTGTETKPLLFVGFGMILAGAVLVFGTRRPRTNPIA